MRFERLRRLVNTMRSQMVKRMLGHNLCVCILQAQDGQTMTLVDSKRRTPYGCWSMEAPDEACGIGGGVTYRLVEQCARDS